MTHARQALDALRATVELLPRAAKLPPVQASAQMLESLAARDAAPALPAGDVLLAVRRRLLQAERTTAGIAAAAARDLRDAPWLMWSETEPIAGWRGLLEAVLRLGEHRAAVRRSLIEGWIKGFSTGAPRIAEAGHGIRRLLAKADDPRLETWRAADGWCRLFDAQEGPRTVARHIVQGADSIGDVLAKACLDDPLRAVSGYARAVQDEALRLAPERLAGPAGPTAMARLGEFLAPLGSLRFADPDSRGQIACGLLAPWLTGRSPPGESTRAAVQRFLLSCIGDPRTRAGQWSQAGDDAVALMRRWLARASLNAFFEVIRDHALDHQWRFREAFWSACLEAGGIDDAWLALGKAVHTSARTLQDLNGAYARLAGSGVQGEQSILLLRVRNTVFSEWSHNGKLRAWPIDWKTAPRLYQREYGRDDVVGKGLPFPTNPKYGSNGSSDANGLSHVSSERHRWQGSVARMLADRAGVHLTHHDWTPK